MGKLAHLEKEPENPFAEIVQGQKYALVPEYTLESGITLRNIPVAYKSWGVLNKEGTNAMVICHALSGSADVRDWWGPLIGPGKAFDTDRFFIICLNSLGSPYGSASPCTIDPETGYYYGPEFPLVTVKDDVRIHKIVLDDLGVTQIAAAVGGSMGGMTVLEYCFLGIDYVRIAVPLATSARHSAWCISWGEAQRQSIYSDPKYDDGYYSFDDPPTSGLYAARMSALLTYRSRNSFESRFGRNVPDPIKHKMINSPQPLREPETPSEENWLVHNDGHRLAKRMQGRSPTPDDGSSDNLVNSAPAPVALVGRGRRRRPRQPQTYFSAQSYLRYQGDKFVKRFDANCYIAITRKLDTHDVSRGRGGDVHAALATLEQPMLVIGIESDGLFTFEEQRDIAEHVKHARLERINSPEGHDAFLLEFVQINQLLIDFFHEMIPDIMDRELTAEEIAENRKKVQLDDDVVKNSVFGEAEVKEVTNW